MTSRVIVGILALATSACVGDGGPVDPYATECLRPSVDTTGWQRVTESRPAAMARMEISYLVPPSFERVGSYAWERHATRTEWFATESTPLPDPFPQMAHSGGCRAQISDHRAFVDYGSLGGDVATDNVILAYWRSAQMAGTSGDILFSARMRDPADGAIIERMIWSVRITRGRGG